MRVTEGEIIDCVGRRLRSKFQFLTFGEEVDTVVQPKKEKVQQFYLRDSRS